MRLLFREAGMAFSKRIVFFAAIFSIALAAPGFAQSNASSAPAATPAPVTAPAATPTPAPETTAPAPAATAPAPAAQLRSKAYQHRGSGADDSSDAAVHRSNQ